MMHKYWKLITLVILITVGIATFYVQFAKLTDEFPQFTLKQKEGEKDVAEAITMNGNVQVSMSTSEPLQVTAANDTTYKQDESFIKRLQGFYKSEKYEQRKKEYRDFMRGKIDDDQFYDENDDYLAYAEFQYGGWISRGSLAIEVLDKGSNNNRVNMDIPFDQAGDAAYMTIKAVKLVDDRLMLIMDDNGEGELLKYAVDLKEEKIIEKEKVYTAENDQFDRYSTLTYLFSEDHSSENMLIVDEQTIYEQTEEEETAETNINYAAVYDLVTNEKKEIELPEGRGIPVAYNDDTIYLSDVNGKELTISEYDREQEEVIKELSTAIETPPEVEAESDTQYVVENGKLYISVGYYEDDFYPQVMVADLANMEYIYKGEVVLASKEPYREKDYLDVYIGEMEVTTDDES